MPDREKQPPCGRRQEGQCMDWNRRLCLCLNHVIYSPKIRLYCYFPQLWPSNPPPPFRRSDFARVYVATVTQKWYRGGEKRARRKNRQPLPSSHFLVSLHCFDAAPAGNTELRSTAREWRTSLLPEPATRVVDSHRPAVPRNSRSNVRHHGGRVSTWKVSLFDSQLRKTKTNLWKSFPNNFHNPVLPFTFSSIFSQFSSLIEFSLLLLHPLFEISIGHSQPSTIKIPASLLTVRCARARRECTVCAYGASVSFHHEPPLTTERGALPIAKYASLRSTWLLLEPLWTPSSAQNGGHSGQRNC